MAKKVTGKRKHHETVSVEDHHRDWARQLYLAIEHSAPTLSEFEEWAQEFANLEASWTLGTLGDKYDTIDHVLSWYCEPPWNGLLPVFGVNDAKAFCERFAVLRMAEDVIWNGLPDEECPTDDPNNDPGEDADPSETVAISIDTAEVPDKQAV